MEELDVFKRMSAIAEGSHPLTILGASSELEEKVNRHRAWLKSIRHEQPSTNHPFKVGVYIRYFNQTKHSNYLDYHIKQFSDTLALCPKWSLQGFYVDEGSSPPNMESAPEWSRLLDDCLAGKIDLIITQKVSNVSKRPTEVTLCARLLAAQTPPIGIYFISEDIFTLASYYQEDLKDPGFFPSSDWKILPEETDGGLLND